MVCEQKLSDLLAAVDTLATNYVAAVRFVFRAIHVF